MAEQTMVERVARALHASLGYGQDWPHPECTQCVSAARAAIEAMREPTNEMADAGIQHTGDPCWEDDVKQAWRAMVDKALAKPSP